MARQSLDDADIRDPRLAPLAAELGMSRRELLGTLVDVRAVFHDRRTYAIPARDIDLVAGIAGFADTLIRWEMARETRAGVAIDSVRESVAYLIGLRQRSINGGKKSAAKRASRASGRLNHALKSSDPDPSLIRSDPDPDPDQGTPAGAVVAPVLSLFGEAPQPRKPPAKAPDGYAEVVEAYFAAFAATRSGAKPTMGAKEGAQIKKLLKDHGRDDVLDRMRRMFSGSVPWPPGPYDLDVLVRHYNRYAPGGTSGGRGRYEPESR